MFNKKLEQKIKDLQLKSETQKAFIEQIYLLMLDNQGEPDGLVLLELYNKIGDFLNQQQSA